MSALCLALAACTAGAVDDGSRVSAPAGGTSSETSSTAREPAADIVPLLTRPVSFLDQEATLAGAEATVLAQCMQAAGLRYVAATGADLTRNYPTAAPNLEQRRTDGYGLGTQLTSSGAPRAPQNDEYVRTLSPSEQQRYQLVLMGSDDQRVSVELPDKSTREFPAQGCIGQARSKIYGSTDSWARVNLVPQSYARLAEDSVVSDQRYIDALAGWAACMRGSGLPYESPHAARQAMESRYRQSGVSDSLRAEEVRVAVRDGECALEAKIPEIVEAGYSRYVREMPPEKLAELADAHRLRVDAIRAANDIH